MKPSEKYKFKVINGILSWRNGEMDRYMPISAEILTRVLLLYEREIKNGLEIFNSIRDQQNGAAEATDRCQELFTWMENLKSIFENSEPAEQKKAMWNKEHPIHLN